MVFLGKCISSRISLETVSYLLSSFQLMETGLTGRTGATVLSRVVAECKIGLELVPILRRLLVESRALERVMKPDCATKILAQVKFLLCNFFARFEDSEVRRSLNGNHSVAVDEDKFIRCLSFVKTARREDCNNFNF